MWQSSCHVRVPRLSTTQRTFSLSHEQSQVYLGMPWQENALDLSRISAAHRSSCSSSKKRCSRSHRRDRCSHSSCCQTAEHSGAWDFLPFVTFIVWSRPTRSHTRNRRVPPCGIVLSRVSPPFHTSRQALRQRFQSCISFPCCKVNTFNSKTKIPKA